MSLRFIYGRSGTGKSYFCLNDIKEEIDKGVSNKLILIVPEQFSFESEKRLLRHTGDSGVFKAEVLSFKRLCHKIFNTVGGITHRRLNDAGKAMIMYSVLDKVKKELQVFQRASSKQGFTDVLIDIITEFKRYNITPEILNDTLNNVENGDLKGKLEDLYRIYSIFESKLHESYIDGEDELTMAYEKIDDFKLLDGAEIWIDEFSTFTPQQYNIIEKLMKKAKRVNITLCSNGHNYSQEVESEDIFSIVQGTENNILQIAMNNNIALDNDIDLNREDCYRFINANELLHVERNFFKFPYNLYKPSVANLRMYKAFNPYEEVDWIARDITSLVRDKGYRYRDIAVVCRDLDCYEKIVSVIFNDYNVPYFLDKKRELTDNPLIVLILSIFDIKNRNWSYESIFRYLKTGILDIERENIDILENFVLAHGIRGKKWQEFWQYGLKSAKNQEEYKRDVLNPINEIKDIIIEPLNKLYEKMSKKCTVRELCTYIYEFLIEVNALNKVQSFVEEFKENGDNEKANEYDKVIDVVLKVLDQIVEIMGEEKVDLDSFINTLNIGLERQEIGLIPVSLDQVIVGDLARIKSHDLKAVYIIGVNDGVFPKVSSEEGILSDDDRSMLKELGVAISADTRTKAFEENFLVYNAITMASNYMVITYPLSDMEGGALRPSVLISRFKKLFPKLLEESELFKTKEDEILDKIVAPEPTFNELISVMRTYYDNNETVKDIWSEVYSWFKDKEGWRDKAERVFKGLSYNNQVGKVNEYKIKSLYKRPFTFDVSKVERYAQCPFAYFVQYGLKARDRKIYEFGNPDFGSFVHDVLDKFSKKVKEENLSWNDIDENWCKENVDRLVEGLIDEESILKSSSRYEYMSGRMKKLITKSVTVISDHFKRGSFNVLDSEIIFGEGKHKPIKLTLKDGEEINLRGRIDRVDVLEHKDELYIRIVDYKSGNKKFSLEEVYHGLQLQLLIYLDAILQNEELLLSKNVIPGAILYFRVDDPLISTDGKISKDEIKRAVLKNLKMNGLLLNSAEVIIQMDREINGYSLIIPAYVGKNGVSENNSSVATREQFNMLREYVRETIVKLCEEMLNGNIDIHPVKKSNNSCCDYCDFKAICQFDSTIKNNKYNTVVKKNKEDLWKLIENKVKEGEEGETNEN